MFNCFESTNFRNFVAVLLYIAHSFFNVAAIYDKEDNLNTYMGNVLNMFFSSWGLIYYIYMLKKMNRETI